MLRAYAKENCTRSRVTIIVCDYVHTIVPLEESAYFANSSGSSTPQVTLNVDQCYSLFPYLEF